MVGLINEGEKTIFGENIRTLDKFIMDLCVRMDNFHGFVMEEKNQNQQKAYVSGFFNGFTNRLNRMRQKIDAELFLPVYRGKLRFEGEETFHGESIRTPEDFIDDFCVRLDAMTSSAMEERDEMARLAYLIGSLIGLKSRLNRVCGRV